MPRAGAQAVVLAALLLGSAGAAPRREPPLLLGGARARPDPVIPIDPRLPTGALVGGAPRPASTEPAYCSFSRPLCVHRGAASADLALAALAALEIAHDQLVSALGLPAPLGDAGLGGGDAFDAYLEPADAELALEPDPPFAGAFARASGSCRLPAFSPDLLARAATLCLGEAIALGLDASEPPHLRRAFATSLWWTVGLPTALDFEAVDEVQAHPEAAIATRELGRSSEGAALFFSYLEAARSDAGPGVLGAALFAAAGSPPPAAGAASFANEPDLFDVLRHSLEEPARFAALMGDFAVTRAFLGARDDGLHLPELAWAGAFGAVRFDWSIRFSSLPRRVAVQPSVDSTGAVLLFLDLDEVGIGAALGFRAEWEAPIQFQWQLVRVGASGEELGRVDVPFQERGRDAEARVTDLIGARAVLIVGTNLEGIEIAHPFDPDVAPFEPHGVTVYLVRL